MRIDSHHHIWNLTNHPQTWMSSEQKMSIGRDFSIGDWKEAANPSGVHSSIVVQTVESFTESLELLELAERSPSIAGVVGWVDANSSDPGAEIEQLKLAPGGDHLVSIRDLTEYRSDDRWLAGPAASRLFDAAGQHDIAVDLLIRERHIPAAVEGVHNHPQTRFILNHLAKPNMDTTSPMDWVQTVAGFAAVPNVALKFSGIATLTSHPDQLVEKAQRYLHHAWKLFGHDQVMFGSDWPVSNTAATYGFLVKSIEAAMQGATAAQQEQFWVGAAQEWYKLERMVR